jgi:pimeloyl-ACP methyl ester carboxylesterase
MGSYVEIGELKTWCDEQGEGEPLVLLHRGMSTNETWGPQMPDFGARFRVIAPERRGHGCVTPLGEEVASTWYALGCRPPPRGIRSCRSP